MRKLISKYIRWRSADGNRLLRPGKPPTADLLTGCALSQWLTNDEANDEAAAEVTFHHLIEIDGTWAGREKIASHPWPAAEVVPMEGLRVATLARFPEATPETTLEP